jgi:hypothetical protein
MEATSLGAGNNYYFCPDNIMSTQPLFDIRKYPQLLELTYQVIQSLDGKKSTDPRWPDCQQLAAKLFFHAATVYSIKQGTKISLDKHKIHFYDFASIAVIMRSAIETFLTMFEVFFEPSSDDEFEFNHALWKLSGFIVREDFSSPDPSLQSQLIQAKKEIQELKTRIQRTKKYALMSPKEQKDVLKGRRRRDWTGLLKASGFGESYLRRIYAYYSGYVHADGLSSVQIVSAKTVKEQVENCDAHLRVMMIVMSKLIVEYAKKFTEAKEICEESPKAFYLANILVDVISRFQ